MKEPKVNIIVSLYNGEKYIREQLNSLLEQDYPNISIHIRDDGSTDNTLEILKEYQDIPNIHIYKGKNLGFCGSFFWLLENVEDGDYWSFCDQDDIWYKNKVSDGVRKLEKAKNKDIPLLYFSGYRMIDEKGKEIGVWQYDVNNFIFRRNLTGTLGVGFSMIINRKLREKMLKCDYRKMHSHDWLAGAVATGMGKVIIGKGIYADYRRLQESVTRISFGRRVKWFVSMFTDNGDVKDRNIEFSKHFYNELSPRNKKYMDMFKNRKYNLYFAFKKAFYFKRWRPSISSEIAMRVLMLFGKV